MKVYGSAYKLIIPVAVRLVRFFGIQVCKYRAAFYKTYESGRFET